jgi:hypothetical protein
MPAYSSRFGCCPEILLDQNCRISYCHNSTSATTENSEGLSVDVSFEIRGPPALSLCFVRCYDLTGRQRFSEEPKPSIIGVAGGLVLLDIPFWDGDGDINQWSYTDYFVYRAGPGAPSLHLLPGPYPAICSMKVAILPIYDDVEHYAVVFPFVQFVVLDSSHHYTLYIYRSDCKAWCTRVARIADDMETQNAMLKLALHYPTSVVHAGPGLIGWVDLWWGVLLCNVLDESPTIRFVAVPVPEPCETLTEFFVKFEDQNRAKRPYRQMTVHNGVMKFIELELHRGPACFNTKRRDDPGWTATTWTRPISSDVWHKSLTFDTSDISVTDWSSLHLLLPEILDGERKLTWEKFISGAPTLSLHDDHIVYIVVKSVWHQTAFILAVNTRSLTLESCAQCSGEMIASLEPTYVPSALSSYFGMTTFVLP